MKGVAVVGLGYVGLTLAVTLARKGFTVFGCDRDPRVVATLGAGRPHLFEPGLEDGLHEFLGERLHVAATLPREPVD
ncbi:MAG: nucleotide sugar dehydrogenase, partial [Candidatus Rokubacteria bacterium]|nr:nucleotide sugar dehydrogenase [Candidatus Rokubacteria bacterium]